MQIRGIIFHFFSDELDYINTFNEQNSVLKVAVNPDRKPYSYYEDGKIQGIIPRIFEETAKRIGIQYEIVTVKTRQEYQDLLSSGTIDACLDEIYAPSEANDRGFRLTDPYLSTSIAQIVKNDFSGKVDKIAIL